ncbi:furin-like protease 2, partial [Limulus polyphemus]|uniref:Furin-like protease 2 n=1 Tax=Limulus polyphemus TaxID=6850 RepID=A0ABM1C0W7_LIMPO
YFVCLQGVRMLDGDVTDAVEARSLSLNPQHIDIYSASWGPDDDGRTVDGPGELATKAFIHGVEKGRNGLGSIFVWASGNGGRNNDNCNCDGYTNSIWTLSISSATENGLVPWYSEACSSTLAATYSSGSGGERQIYDLFAVSCEVSHSFGYGVMDAAAMVKLAKNWKTVPEQKVCTVNARFMDKIISPKTHIDVSLNIRCEKVKFLEHVQAQITLSSTRRGDIHIYLISPMGTKSTLLERRPLDTYRSGFVNWPFLTVHNWGENPNGEWKLEIHNEGRFFGRASLTNWTMIFYGTSEDPQPLLKTKLRSLGSSISTNFTSTSTFPTTEDESLLPSTENIILLDEDFNDSDSINYNVSSFNYDNNSTSCNSTAFPGMTQSDHKCSGISSVEKKESEFVESVRNGFVSKSDIGVHPVSSVSWDTVFKNMELLENGNGCTATSGCMLLWCLSLLSIWWMNIAAHQ